MNILIVEDEPLVAVSLSRLIKELEPDAIIEGPVVSVKDAGKWLRTKQPDLILADIQLADGISLDIFSGGAINCPIIFTTAYNEYAIRAFKLNSIDYLLKPVEKAELQAALQKFHRLQAKYSNETFVKQVTELFDNFHRVKKYKERFAVHVGRSVTVVPQQETAGFIKEEIIYLLSHEGKKFITDYRSLDEVQELLDPQQFYRANRQWIVQLPFVESFRTDELGKVYLKLKSIGHGDIIVSKEKAAEFRKWFEQ